MLDEHLRAGGLGAATPDVVDDRPADVLQQRQAERPARLVLDDRDPLRPPVQIAQLKVTQIRDPQPEPRGRQDHRVVAFTGGGLTVNHGQHPGNLIRGPQVRLGLVTEVPVGRQPIRQTARCPARRGQEVQEIRQARPHGRNRFAPQMALAQQETRHVPHAEHREIIDTHLVQMTQEPDGRPVFRDHGRLGVAASTARSEVVVPQRTELRGTTVLRRNHGPININRPIGQHVCHQQHRPTNRLNSPVFDRLPQRRQPDPGLARDEVDAHPLARRVHTTLGQEHREPLQHRLLTPDCALGPASLAQHRHDTDDGIPDICLSHENHLCIR